MLKGTNIFKKASKVAAESDRVFRSNHSSEGFTQQKFRQTASKNYFNQSKMPNYPATKQLPLPSNIKGLASSEKLKFSPQRSRDINGSFISHFTSISPSSSTSFYADQSKLKSHYDDRVECYCSGVVNLSSTMQTNVPFPFVSKGEPTHLNIVGCHWEQKEKYVSEDLNNCHHSNTQQSYIRKGTSFTLGSKTGKKNFFHYPSRDLNYCSNISSIFSIFNSKQFRQFCKSKEKIINDKENVKENSEPKPGKIEAPQLSNKEKLKVAVKDYGVTAVVFHVSISLISLGCCYAIVSSGVDLSYILKEFGTDEGAVAAGTAAHFVIAYAVHKTLAPVRISFTLAAVPFIVKKLRKIGILKTARPKSP